MFGNDYIQVLKFIIHKVYKKAPLSASDAFLAGPLRIELRTTVLETGILPLNYGPTSRPCYNVLKIMSK